MSVNQTSVSSCCLLDHKRCILLKSEHCIGESCKQYISSPSTIVQNKVVQVTYHPDSQSLSSLFSEIETSDFQIP